MKDKTKILIILVIAFVIIVMGGILAQVFTNQDLNETLNLIIVPSITIIGGSITGLLITNHKKDE